MIILDTNVISALWSGSPVVAQVTALLGRVATEGALVVCGPVYAELVAHPKVNEQFVDQFLATTACLGEERISHDLRMGLLDIFIQPGPGVGGSQVKQRVRRIQPLRKPDRLPNFAVIRSRETEYEKARSVDSGLLDLAHALADLLRGDLLVHLLQ